MPTSVHQAAPPRRAGARMLKSFPKPQTCITKQVPQLDPAGVEAWPLAVILVAHFPVQ